MPSRGAVRVVRHVTADSPELPEPGAFRPPAKPPRDNAPPDDIVRGFLVAHGDPRNDRAIARTYLVPQAVWNDKTGVTIATTRVGVPVVTGDAATVPLTLDRVGTISPSGEFRPAPAPARESLTLRLRRVAGLGWRLVAAPPGLVLGPHELSGTFDRTTLYFPSQARRLVPDTVFLPASDQPVGAAVRALLVGPRGWIARAVRSALPNNTELLGTPSVVDRVATVNFSREITLASQETLGAFVAQLVWTLTENTSIDAVRVQVEGQPLAVPGRPGLRDHRRIDWTLYAPVPETSDTRLFFVRDGGAYAVDDSGRESRLPVTQPLASLAVNRAGTRLAGVTAPAGGRQSLILVDLANGAAVRTALTADRVTAPTWEPGGDVVWVASTSGGAQQVLAVPATPGPPATVAAALAGPVTSLRLSPDGTRAALVVGAGALASLWLARVEHPAAGGRLLADPRPVASSLRRVTAVAFDGAVQLLLAVVAGGRPALYRVDLDGYNLTRQRDDRLPAAAVTALAVTAPAERVASVAGTLWRRTPGSDWKVLPGRGAAAVFAD
jgi:hypothetical protein